MLRQNSSTCTLPDQMILVYSRQSNNKKNGEMHMYAGGAGPITTDTNLKLDRQFAENSRKEARELELQTLSEGMPDATESLLSGLGLFGNKSEDYIATLQHNLTKCKRKLGAIIRLKNIVGSHYEEEKKEAEEKSDPLIKLLQKNIITSISYNKIDVLDKINILVEDAKIIQIFKDSIKQAYTNKTLKIKACEHVEVVDVLDSILNDKQKLFSIVVEIYRRIDDKYSVEQFRLEKVDKTARL
jgi:hypothetical protein